MSRGLTDEEIIHRKGTSILLDLEGRELILPLDPDEYRKICNGIGPEWMPEALRDFVSELHPTLQLPADIHDVMYHHGDGTKSHFYYCNAVLERNGIRCAKANYKWYDPRRYLVVHKARQFRRLCDLFGWKAYVEACATRW